MKIIIALLASVVSVYGGNPSFQDTTNIVSTAIKVAAGTTNSGIYSSVLLTNWTSPSNSFGLSSAVTPISVTLPAGRYFYSGSFFAIGGDTNGAGVGYSVSQYPQVLFDTTTVGANGAAGIASMSQYPRYAPSGLGGFSSITGSSAVLAAGNSGTLVCVTNITFTIIGGGITTGRTGVTFFAGSGIIFRKAN